MVGVRRAINSQTQATNWPVTFMEVRAKLPLCGNYLCLSKAAVYLSKPALWSRWTYGIRYSDSYVLQLSDRVEKLCQMVKAPSAKDLPLPSYNSCMYTAYLNTKNQVLQSTTSAVICWNHCKLRILCSVVTWGLESGKHLSLDEQRGEVRELGNRMGMGSEREAAEKASAMVFWSVFCYVQGASRDFWRHLLGRTPTDCFN